MELLARFIRLNDKRHRVAGRAGHTAGGFGRRARGL
jgi:hypothetical protein